MGKGSLHSFSRIFEANVTFPEFNIDNIQFKASTLESWLKSLPENSQLRIFHTDKDGIRVTWLEDHTNNTIFMVSEDKK